MSAVSGVLWKDDGHVSLWREHDEFLRTADGVAYKEALIAEVDVFRATLRQWEEEARASQKADG